MITIDITSEEFKMKSQDIDPNRYYTTNEIEDADFLCGLIKRRGIKRIFGTLTGETTKREIKMEPMEHSLVKMKGRFGGRYSRYMVKGDELLKFLALNLDGNILYTLRERRRINDLLILSTGSTNHFR